MTRNRKLKRNIQTPASVQQQHSASMAQVQAMLENEQTGNYGVLHPDDRLSIAQIRDFDRHMSQPFNDPRVRLPNPTARAPFDRTRPQGNEAKNEAFGFQTHPERIIDLPPGDAGAGKSVYRRTQIFARLNPSTSV